MKQARQQTSKTRPSSFPDTEDASKVFVYTRPVFHLQFDTRVCPQMRWGLGFVS